MSKNLRNNVNYLRSLSKVCPCLGHQSILVRCSQNALQTKYTYSTSHYSLPKYNATIIKPMSTLSAVPPATVNDSELSENEYEFIAEETLLGISDIFEDILEEDFTSADFDVTYSSGVLTVKLGDGKGTYVINRQSPNKQIWLSSPLSGPKRYDFIAGSWIYRHDNNSLHSLLSEELSKTYGRSIDFLQCPHSGQSRQ